MMPDLSQLMPTTQGINFYTDLPSSWPLTRREREVCNLLLRGQSNRQIAATLVISENTVEAYCAHVYEKLGIHSRSELLSHFFQEGHL